jgi:hypothetical protein
VTGVRKKMSESQSFKKTDPISLKYEKFQSQTLIREFEASPCYKKEVEQRITLPCERNFSHSRIVYKSQLGYSRSLDQGYKHKPSINNSSNMKEVLQSSPRCRMGE